MKITSVKVKKEEREGSRMKGRASITIDDGYELTKADFTQIDINNVAK